MPHRALSDICVCDVELDIHASVVVSVLGLGLDYFLLSSSSSLPFFVSGQLIPGRGTTFFKGAPGVGDVRDVWRRTECVVYVCEDRVICAQRLAVTTALLPISFLGPLSGEFLRVRSAQQESALPEPMRSGNLSPAERAASFLRFRN